MQYGLLFLMWLAFYALHSILASSRVKWNICTALPVMHYVYRILYNVFFTISFLAIIKWAQQIPPLAVFEKTRALHSAGIILSLLGLLGVMISFKYYDKTEFIGFRNLRYGSKVFGDKPVFHGPNRYVRHPLYFATLLLMIGYFLYYPFYANLISVVSGMIYIVIGIHFEEKKLIRQFGDAYIAYRQKTPRLIPFIW